MRNIMTRQLNIIIVVTLICSVAIVVFWLQKLPENQNSKNNPNTNNSSVEDTLKLYWAASLKGDNDSVMQLAALPSKDFLQDCTGAKKVNETNNEIYVKPFDVPNDKNDNPIERDDGKKMVNPFTSNGVSESVNGFSEFIYMRRIAFDRVKLVEKTIYQQEALLEVHISDSSGNFSDPFKYFFFFTNEGNGWKIIGVGNKNTLLSISKKINFATPRPACEER